MKLVGYLFRSLYRSIRGRLTFPRKIKYRATVRKIGKCRNNRWPLHALTRHVRWNVCKEIQAAHIQSAWRLAEAEFIIINRKNIKLFHFTISGDRKTGFFFNLYFTYLFGSRCSSDKWALSRDNISKIQLDLLSRMVIFELFSFSANLSFSFLFYFYILPVSYTHLTLPTIYSV